MTDHDPDHDEEDAKALGCTARLEIRWAKDMTDGDRIAVADWIRRQADMLIAEGFDYAAIYTASLDPED